MKKRIFSILLALVILLSAVPFSASAAEAGATMSNPVDVAFGQIYSKYWTRNDDHLNYFLRFTLTEQGILSLRATKPVDGEGEYFRMEITLYDEDGDPVTGNNCFREAETAKDFYLFHFGLNAGTYYINILPKFKVHSGQIGTEYSLTFQPEEYCEIESNNDASHATVLALNQTYTGYFGSGGSKYEEKDYYKIMVTEGHVYRVLLDNFGEMSEGNTMLKLLCDGDEKTIHFKMENQIDDSGMHYYDFTPEKDGTVYIYFDNFSGKQFEYGLTVKDISGEIHVHQYEETFVEPTCKEWGYKLYTCECGESYKESVDRIPHVEDEGKVFRAPTADRKGTMAYYCVMCGSWMRFEDIPALSHTHVYETVVETVHPTCIEQGYTVYACSCGAKTEGDYTDQLPDHIYEDGKCTMCGLEEAEPVIMGDANDDKLVDYMDAMLVLRHAVKLTTLSEEAQARCNVDGKGEIDYMDAMLILRKAVKLIEFFPVEAK